MSNKLFTVIFAIAFIVVPTTQKGNNFKEHMDLLFNNMDDSEVLNEFKDFAQEIFQIESQQEDLYDFLVEFLSKDLEQVSEIGQLNEDQQKERIQQDIQNALTEHFDEKIANQEFELDKEGFQDAFEKVQDLYERQFLAILGRKIKLGDRDLRLPFDFISQLFNQIKRLSSNEAFANHYQKYKVSTINKYIKFLNENQKNFQDQYKSYLKTYANYAMLVTDNYSQLAYDLDSFFKNASENMTEDKRDDMIRRITGLTSVFIRLNNSNEAVTADFRDVDNQDNEEQDNRSDDEKRRDLKDYIILRLQTLRIEAMDEENGSEETYLNLSYITNAVFDAFIKNDMNNHIFYHMRNIFIQNVAVSSGNSVQTKILEQMYNNLEIDEQDLLQQAQQLGDDDVLPQVLFLADVLALPIFEEQQSSKNTYPQIFKTLYQKILAIPAITLQGNGALQLLGHYAIAPEGQDQEYYVEFYQLILKFRLQNNFNLQLLEDHFQSAIAMQFFVNQQYVFEKEHESDSNLVSNYFKFKTTIILHMIAFLDKDEYTEEEELDQLKQMYLVQYEQATKEELNELLSADYLVFRPSNVKTSLKRILQIFADHWEEEEGVSNDVFEFTKEGLDMFSSNSFNLVDIVGEDMKDHITITITQTEGVTKKLPIGLQSNFKIGLYGVEALHYQEAEKNKNLNAQEKLREQKQNTVDSKEDSFQMTSEEKDLDRISIKRKTSTHLQESHTNSSSSQEDVLNQSNSQEDVLNKSNSKEKVQGSDSFESHDISEEDESLLNKNNLQELSFGQGSNQETENDLKLKRQNHIKKNLKQGEEFSFGNNLKSSQNSSEEDTTHKNITEDTSSEEKDLNLTQTYENTQKYTKPVLNSEEDLVHNNLEDLEKNRKIEMTSSEEDQVHNNLEDLEKNKKIEMTSSEEQDVQSQNSQEQTTELNRINGNKVKSPSNTVTFISGQALNQKEEEYLQDPNLINKLKQNKDENNQVTFENDDGSITEIVYVQIIPYGSDCYNSYQAALLNN